MRRTFSDNWYRIADLRLGLRSGVSIRRHESRGEAWYVLHEHAHAGFFRINPTTYRFLARIHVDATLDEIWRAAVTDAAEETPGQEEVFELVVALYRANLVVVAGGVDESKIIERVASKKRKPLTARLSELLFMKVPLWDPDRWFNRRTAAIELIFSKVAALLLLGLVSWAAWEFILAGSRAWDQAQHILQLNNLLLLYLAIFSTHLLHEMAHGAVCKYFGGEVRGMGVMLLMFTPLPYVDVSASWTFRSPYQRALVASAGMVADLATGAFATLIWAYSPPGLLNELSYNLMFSTVIYTILFNINPLMRFDGYYILSDLIGIPNLHQQASQQMTRWWNGYVLRLPDNGAHIVSIRRQRGLIAFFLMSNVYRLMVMGGIVLFVADQYLGLGLLVAFAMLITSFIQPLQRLLKPLTSSLFRFQHQGLLRHAGLGLLGLMVLLLLVPLPQSQVLDGVVEAAQDTPLYTDSGGIVQRVEVKSGQTVVAGQQVVVLLNPELDAELNGVAAQVMQAQVQENKALTDGGSDLYPIRERLKTLEKLQTTLLKQKQALIVRAPHAGIWVSPELPYRQASWLGRGAELGRVLNEQNHVFSGVIRQEDAVRLVGLQPEQSAVRIEGERDQEHRVQRLTLLPHSQKNLPSAALSPLAGGKVAISTSDPQGKQAAEQFFLLRAELSQEPRVANRAIQAGRSAWIKARLPAQPLALQAWRAVRQFFQRRYQL